MQRQRGAISPNRRLASQTMRELTLACVRGMPNCHPAATSWPRGTGLDDVSRRRESVVCRQSSTAVDIRPTRPSRPPPKTMAWPRASSVDFAIHTDFARGARLRHRTSDAAHQLQCPDRALSANQRTSERKGRVACKGPVPSEEAT